MTAIKDIAQLAGVSKSTVSRYLNGGYVSEDTKKKIESVINETGYVPNDFARSLKARQTNLIGVIVPRIDSSATTQILMHLDEKCRQKDKRLLIVNANQHKQRELEAIETLHRQKVAYILFVAKEVTTEHLALIKSISTPVIVIGQQSNDLPYVTYDDYEAGRKIGDYIVQQQKFTRVLYVSVDESDKAVGYYRKKGVLDTLEKVPEITVDVIHTSFHVEDAYQLGKKFFAQPNQYDYIVSATDTIALGILKAATELKIKVPQHVALSGFGGYHNTYAVYPSLTTVVYPYETVAQAVFDLIENPDITRVVLPVALVERESTMKHSAL